MSLDLKGIEPRIVGEIVIENYSKGIIFNLPVQGGFRFDTEHALYAPWWLPDEDTDAEITLFNSSSTAIHVSSTSLMDAPEVRQTWEVEAAERQLICSALEAEGGRVARAGRRLGIPRSTLYKKIRRYGI